jgi:hypothetical protein
VTHPLWLAELCPRKWWGRRVLPPLPLACQTSALLMSYVPENGAGERSRTVVSALARPHSAIKPHPQIGVPNRALTGNLTLRTRLLYALSYGDKELNPWPVSSTGSHPALSKVVKKMKGLGRSICFAFGGSKWYARPACRP